ncbi:50S ribosomal protein L17 [Diaporthe helianthi]|uniref:Large ribosomal subunit protein bL17m n=1 Tax=Diaporthe helianthi TaxID=158607 RepID=A0A2P5I0V6_DIAHE|nr:50S ribosomal protein L17 [Diaporthe helianthi]
MAGGHMKFRTLSRNSSHRQALLRNLVTSLVKQESIQTTWPKAKEAQRLADKLITLAKRNNETSRREAQSILYWDFQADGHGTNRQTPDALLPKLFGELRERYLMRPGGYTRVLRTEPKNRHDQAPSAILELVDGERDMRFAMTAAAVARDEVLGRDSSQITKMNIKKLTAFRKDGEAEFRALVEEIKEREGKAMRNRAENDKAIQDSLYKFHISTPKVRRPRRTDGQNAAEGLD